MAKTLEVEIGSYNWTHSAWFHEDLAELDEPAAECLTCQGLVTGAYWYCDEDGEVVHETCEIPARG
jgi:hypothetical protein